MELIAISTFYVLSEERSKFREQYRVVFVDISYQLRGRFCSQPKGYLSKGGGKALISGLACWTRCSAELTVGCRTASAFTPASVVSLVVRGTVLPRKGGTFVQIRDLCLGIRGMRGDSSKL